MRSLWEEVVVGSGRDGLDAPKPFARKAEVWEGSATMLVAQLIVFL